MGFDWQSYLNEQLKASQAPQGETVIPQSPWSSLAQIMHLVGTAMAVPKAQAQSQFIQGETQAKEFGLPGLRAFYESPEAQRLAQVSGRTIPSLPPLSAEELKQQRFQDFYTAIGEKMKGVKGKTIPGAITETGRKGEEAFVTGPEQQLEPTPADYRAAIKPVLSAYPDVAQAEGFTTKVGASEMAALINRIGGLQDPSQAALEIGVWLQSTGQEFKDLDPYVQNALVNLQNPLYTAEVNKRLAQAQEAVSASGLKEQQKNDLKAKLAAQVKEIQAHTQELISQGHFAEAHAYFETETAKMVKPLAESKEALEASQVRKNDAIAFAQQHNNNYKDALTQYTNAKANALKVGPDSMPGVKLTVTSLQKQIENGTKSIGQIRNQITQVQYIRPQDVEGLNDQIKQIEAENEKARKTINDLNSGKIKPSQIEGATPDPTTNIQASPVVQGTFNQAVNIIQNPANKLSARDGIVMAYKHVLHDPAAQANWKLEDYDAFWNLLVNYARAHGVKEDIPRPGATE
jgi:hypothetical protein